MLKQMEKPMTTEVIVFVEIRKETQIDYMMSVANGHSYWS